MITSIILLSYYGMTEELSANTCIRLHIIFEQFSTKQVQ